MTQRVNCPPKSESSNQDGSNDCNFEYYGETTPPHTSEDDSMETKISIVPLKRLAASPPPSSMPLKKRLCMGSNASPFRPWVPSSTGLGDMQRSTTSAPDNKHLQPRPYNLNRHRPPSAHSDHRSQTPPLDLALKPARECRVPSHPPPTFTTAQTAHLLRHNAQSFSTLTPSPSPPSSDHQSSSTSPPQPQQQQQQHQQNRSYKNMTRERRIEANARERTRVHTISAAYDTLRHAIPAYSHDQKLSKLSVLRIACSYIMTLSNIVGINVTPPLGQCIEMVTKTIQREGKVRKKKDDDDRISNGD